MIVYRGDLGAGMQPDIFKRFRWWEEESRDDMQEKFGVTIWQRSFKDPVARANAVADSAVQDTRKWICGSVPIVGLSPCAQADALPTSLPRPK